MKITIMNGSPRKNGNTSELINSFVVNLPDKADVQVLNIFDMDLKGCRNCGACQKAVLESHCTIEDDMSVIYPEFLRSDMIILASPIYMWQFTPCTLAFLNRLHCLCRSEDYSYNDMKGKEMAVLTTMGAEEEVADFAIDALKEFCEFFMVEYKGDLRIPYAQKEVIASGEFDAKIKEFIQKIL